MMALITQGNQVLLAIRSQLAPQNKMMDLQLIAPAAGLAFPAIPLQDFQLQLTVTFGVEPKLSWP
jgi:hypothetical protein